VLDTLTNPNGTSYLIHDADGNPLALKTYQGSYSYYVLDGLGTPIALVNTSGTVNATYTYDPWGNVTVGNPTNSVAANLNPYRFAGGMLDRSTNYVKFGMRYYDPGTGRFTQQDSIEVIGNPSHGNRYQYAGDNPVNYIDPSGQFSFTDLLVTVGIDTLAGTLSGAAAGCVAGLFGTVIGCVAAGSIGALTGFVGGFVYGVVAGTLTQF
jgi:RHS repeat-associated protein